MGRPSKYTEEFRRDAVDLVRSSQRPINQVARELGMSHETLRNWVRAAERQTQTGPAASGEAPMSPGSGGSQIVYTMGHAVSLAAIDCRQHGLDGKRKP